MPKYVYVIWARNKIDYILLFKKENLTMYFILTHSNSTLFDFSKKNYRVWQMKYLD